MAIPVLALGALYPLAISFIWYDLVPVGNGPALAYVIAVSGGVHPGFASLFYGLLGIAGLVGSLPFYVIARWEYGDSRDVAGESPVDSQHRIPLFSHKRARSDRRIVSVSDEYSPLFVPVRFNSIWRSPTDEYTPSIQHAQFYLCGSWQGSSAEYRGSVSITDPTGLDRRVRTRHACHCRRNLLPTWTLIEKGTWTITPSRPT